jgi:hypothetical protein
MYKHICIYLYIDILYVCIYVCIYMYIYVRKSDNKSAIANDKRNMYLANEGFL